MEHWTRILKRRAYRRAATFQELERERSPDDRNALADWLTRSPRNVRAYLAGAALDELLAQLRPRELAHGRPSRRIASVILRASRRAQAQQAAHRARVRTAHLNALIRGATLVFACGVPFAGIVHIADTRPEFTLYETLPNEIRRVALEDGSSVLLNMDSRIRVHFTAEERRVELDRGQVLFSVAHAQRPFRVRTQHTLVEAIGTQFGVASSVGAVRINVLEGHVAVTHAETHTDLFAGDEVAIQRGRFAKRRVGERPTRNLYAWAFGRMTWEGESLSDIVDELNRMNRTQIVIDMPELGRMPIGGTFEVTPEEFVAALHHLGVASTAIQNSDGRRVLHLHK